MSSTSYPLAPGSIRQIPVLHLQYGHRIFQELAARGRQTLRQLFDDVGAEELFKGDRIHKAPLQRARLILRFAGELRLVAGLDPYQLTDVGTAYVEAGDPSSPWDVTTAQQAILRQQLAQLAADPEAPRLAFGTVLALSLMASAPSGYSDEELGRALGFLGGMQRWKEARTFVSQAERFRALLCDAGLIDREGRVTSEGNGVLQAVALPVHPSLSEAVKASASDISPATALSTGVRVWVIRAGREGAYEALALSEGVALIGWHELGALSMEATRDDLKELIAKTYGEQRPASLASQAGQIFRFLHDVQENDLVVLPLRSKPGHVAVGRVRGNYEHRTDGAFAETDAQNTRAVDWLSPSLGYERFDPDLREAFGQQGTVSEISKPSAAQRIIDVLSGADASAIHLVLKWSPALRADTIERHLEVVDAHGAVWWGRQSKPGTTGLADNWVEKLETQLDNGSETFVFLYSSAGTWRTRLQGIAIDQDDVDADLVPQYYDPDTFHSLWVKLTDFEQVDSSELLDGYVLAASGDPVTPGGLGNQTPLIVRKHEGVLPGRYFILSQMQNGSDYDDDEGTSYHWTTKSSGATRQLANSPGAHFVYYRPGEATDGTSRSYFGAGKIAAIHAEEKGGEEGFVAVLEGFERFKTPVPFKDGPNQSAQTSIKTITRVQFERLLKAGGMDSATGELTLTAIQEAADRRRLSLEPSVLAQLFAALESGKHVILTGPPGTAKTTLAQAVAEAAEVAGCCAGYLLTTATADWTTYETIGGLRPTEKNTLEFQEGHFLSAIRANQWLVIDELNRSQFDRAFGQLFTVLSNQPVVLPYHRAGRQPTEPVVLVPEGASSPVSDGDILQIPQSWRIIATMNVFDKSLLFEMSFALMRRFAFVEVASPSQAVFEALIDRETAGEGRAASLTRSLLVLRELKDLGPAVFMDCAKFLRQRIALADEDDGALYLEAFYSYLLPQFEGIDAAGGERLYALMTALVGTAARKERLRDILESVLGLELKSPQVEPPEDEDLDDEEVEQPET